MRAPSLARLSRRALLGGAALAAAGFGPADPTLDITAGPKDLQFSGMGPGDASPLARLSPILPRPAMTAADRAEWATFRQRFVMPDGRVVDTGNHGNSHSEGQGWGLLFAESFDDPDMFDLILGWTASHLRCRGDALHAWLYEPGKPNPIADHNNATDGDVFIAAALARAAIRWGRPDHAEAGAAIARDILALLVRDLGTRTVLLPAADGFEKRHSVVVNPSYYAFGVLPFLEALAPSPAWRKLRTDGLALIEDGRFGRWQLPPDWLRIGKPDGTLSAAPGWPARFSYDAIRVPLHLSWAGLLSPKVRDAFSCYWAATGDATPAWIDLKTTAVATYSESAGMVAVSRLITGADSGGTGQSGLPSRFPTVAGANDYYSAALVLLARLAWKERHAVG